MFNIFKVVKNVANFLWNCEFLRKKNIKNDSYLANIFS